MKHFFYALPLLLVACGAGGSELTLTVSGVAMADLEKIRGELSGLKGVGDVQAGRLKDGQATFAVKFEGKGGELASRLATLGSGLKNVRGFDDASVQISYGGAEASVEKPGAALPVKSPEVAPKPNPNPKDEKKEIKVEMKNDPLAYKVQQLAGGTIATFDNWEITLPPGDGQWVYMETHPKGKDNDFRLIVAVGTPGAQVMANLFEEGSKLLRQLLPAIRPAGDPQKCTIGGDEARIQDYTLEAQGRTLRVQSLIIRKKDIAVSLLALGTEECFKEFGRAVGITAQSITIKADPPDPGLVGTWLLEKYYSSGVGTSSQFSHSSSMSMTIYPNGTFTESSSSASNLNNTTGTTSAYVDGGDRGKVVKRGTVLSFTYDNGKVWNAEFKLDGGALVLNGNYWLRQR